MKKESVFLLILMSILWSCSAVREKGTIHPPLEEGKRQILYWATSEKKAVNEGKLKNSEYWKQFYRKSIELRPDLDDFLCFASEMIKVSRIFEEGKITKKQFEDKQRQLAGLLAREENRRDKKIYLSRMNMAEHYEVELFLYYRESLFLDYVTTLQRQLHAAGPQFPSSRCAFFDDTIQCTTQDPPFNVK